MCQYKKKNAVNELLPGMVTSSEEALICKLAGYNINFCNQRIISIVTTADSGGYNKEHMQYQLTCTAHTLPQQLPDL